MSKFYKEFWGNFNELLYEKVLQSRTDKKETRTFKLGKTLDKDFTKKCKDEGINKTDVVVAGVVKYTYGNKLNVNGAIKIIAKQDTLVGRLAKMAMNNEQDFKDFVQYIHDQADDGNKESMDRIYGQDVIETILNHKIEDNG